MKLDQNKIRKLLEGVEVSEGAIKGLASLVESYVSEQNSATVKRLKEHYEKKLNQISEAAQKYGDYIKEEMTNKISEYTTFAVKDFIKENKSKFAQLEQMARMNAVFESVKTAFEGNGFKLDENATSSKMQKELTEAKNNFNEVFEDFTRVNDELTVAKQALLFEKMTKSLTAVQKSKVKKMTENISFGDLKEFKQGIQLIVENVKRDSTSQKDGSGKYLTESRKNRDEKTDPKMSAILNALRR